MTLYRCPKCGKAILSLDPPTCCGVPSVKVAEEKPPEKGRKRCCWKRR